MLYYLLDKEVNLNCVELTGLLFLNCYIRTYINMYTVHMEM